MMRFMTSVVIAVSVAAGVSLEAADSPFVFRDVGEATGLSPLLAGIQGHGAAWGDADGDGLLDLYVGTFHKAGTKPNQFIRQVNGQFRTDDQPALAISARATGIVFADLDNDGDLDLYVASMPQPKANLTGCTLFRNDGRGAFTDRSTGNGACPLAFGGRSVAVLDFDGDGLLDLLVGEDPLPGYNGSPTKSTRLFRNQGALQFEDVSRAVGLPADIPGLGVAAADVNHDGWPDFYIASATGNVLFLNDGQGRFTEAAGTREVFAWKDARGDNMVCGVCFGDVNRDGWLDILIGQHFERPWREPIANRLYLHRGLRDGTPFYENVTRFGRHVLAVGSNEAAARLCGIDTGRVKIAVYALSSLFAGVAGIMEFSTLTVGDPTDSVGLELEVIAAVVIGGAPLSGGEASVAGSVVGALLMTVIRTGGVHLGLPSWVQEIATGGIIVVAVALDRFRRSRAARTAAG